jgi:hypothetical protein
VGGEASCVSTTSEDGDEVGVSSIRRRFGALSASSSLSCLRLIASVAGDDEEEDEDCVDVLGDEPGSGTGSNSVVVVGAGTGGADFGEDDSGDAAASGTWASLYR